ncbi:MAG: hypothetical protein R3F59_15210 [Myxococcota bacterium]
MTSRTRVPGVASLALGALPDDEAVALLLARARAVRPGWGEGDEAALVELVRRLDGNPLALELAAGRAELLPPRALLDALADRFRLLDAGERTLYAAIEASWAQLGPGEQRALSQCAVFAGGFRPAAAAAVLDARDDGDLWWLDALQRLVGARCWWPRAATPCATGSPSPSAFVTAQGGSAAPATSPASPPWARPWQASARQRPRALPTLAARPTSRPPSPRPPTTPWPRASRWRSTPSGPCTARCPRAGASSRRCWRGPCPIRCARACSWRGRAPTASPATSTPPSATSQRPGPWPTPSATPRCGARCCCWRPWPGARAGLDDGLR